MQITLTPTSANTAAHMDASPTADSTRITAFTISAKAMFVLTMPMVFLAILIT